MQIIPALQVVQRMKAVALTPRSRYLFENSADGRPIDSWVQPSRDIPPGTRRVCVHGTFDISGGSTRLVHRRGILEQKLGSNPPSGLTPHWSAAEGIECGFECRPDFFRPRPSPLKTPPYHIAPEPSRRGWSPAGLLVSRCHLSRDRPASTGTQVPQCRIRGSHGSQQRDSNPNSA